MEKVLSITDRLKDKKREKHKELHRKKAVIVQRVVLCSSCQIVCAMCGSRLKVPDSPCPPPSAYLNLNLCDYCRAEYNDYLEMGKKSKSSAMFWHNKEWMKLWSAWVDFHKAIEKFRDSNEFKQLMKETEQ